MLQCWSTVTFCLGWGCLAWQSDLGKVWNYCNYLKILKVYGVSAKEDRKKKCNEVLEGWIRRDRERKLTKQHGYQEEFIDITQRNNLIPASITLNLTGKKLVYTIYIHTQWRKGKLDSACKKGFRKIPGSFCCLSSPGFSEIQDLLGTLIQIYAKLNMITFVYYCLFNYKLCSEKKKRYFWRPVRSC